MVAEEFRSISKKLFTFVSENCILLLPFCFFWEAIENIV